MQIGYADKVEDARQRKMIGRKDREKSRDERRVNKEAEIEAELEQRVQEEAELEELVKLEEEAAENLEVEVAKTSENLLSQRNHVDLSGVAQTSMRYELPIRGTSAVCTAYLGDLIKAGEISPSKAYLAVDPRKLKRARDNVMSAATERGNQLTNEDTIRAIMFDSRMDETKVNHFDPETGKYYQRIEIQDHYTLTDGMGRFLVHFTKPSKTESCGEEQPEEEEEQEEEQEQEEEEEDNEELLHETPEGQERRLRLEGIINENPKPAAVVAKIMYRWMVIHGIDQTLQFLSGDSTNSNTGWRGGIIAWLERFLGRKVNWLICGLHCNELGLRHLFEELDGKTSSKSGWSGDLGKRLKLVGNMGINYNYEPINVGPSIIDLPEEIVKDLLTDQHLLYRRADAVRSGNLTRDLALRKGGSLVHSRWLTFASELLVMWMSNHGLTGVLLERLRTVVTYIVSLYVPMWFKIKVQHSWLEGPRHVLTHLELLRLQSAEVQMILLPYLKTSSWYAHSESILQTMLCSSDAEERRFAVEKIIKIRGQESFGRTAPRYRKLPRLNVEATKLVDLINWNRSHEPLLTCDLSKTQLKEFLDKPMTVPYYCSNTQAAERAIKEVTAASAQVCGEDRRDGWIRSRCENREIVGQVESKKDLAKLLLDDV